VRFATCSLETVGTMSLVQYCFKQCWKITFLLGADEAFQMPLGAFKLMLDSSVTSKSMN